MTEPKLSYKSFQWAIGTTSFRRRYLNYEIESQLRLVEEWQQRRINRGDSRGWRPDSQADLYDFFASREYVNGEARRKDKDARQLTSGLYELGLLEEDRTLTAVGREIIGLSPSELRQSNNTLMIPEDSLIYLIQLLKLSVSVDGRTVRPVIALLKLMYEHNGLSWTEFTYLAPLVTSPKFADELSEAITQLRNNETSVESLLANFLLKMENYAAALQVFLSAPTVTENLIMQIGINRKSREYDAKYFPIYTALEATVLHGSEDVHELWSSISKLTGSTKALWKSLLFKPGSTSQSVKRDRRESLRNHSPFQLCNTDGCLRRRFFQYLHVYKAMANLKDYADLNRRYLNLTNIFLFTDGVVRLDVVPEAYFSLAIDELYLLAFSPSDSLTVSHRIEELSPALEINEHDLVNRLSSRLRKPISGVTEARIAVSQERERRLNDLLDSRFDNSTLIELLEAFEARKDGHIQNVVTEEAAVPTIFEYVVALAWYSLSGRSGNVLDYMKLSLDANLLPKTHAIGGGADIVYEYAAASEYPQHCLLIEATLTEKTNQRRAEMESVSRHLGRHLLETGDLKDYAVFISTYLDPNVVSDFRARKSIPFFDPTDPQKSVSGMKIIPLSTEVLRDLLHHNVTYGSLYPVLEASYQSGFHQPEWHGVLAQEVAALYSTIPENPPVLKSGEEPS